MSNEPTPPGTPIAEDEDQTVWLAGHVSRREALDQVEDLLGPLDRPACKVRKRWGIWTGEDDEWLTIVRKQTGAVPVTEVWTEML